MKIILTLLIVGSLVLCFVSSSSAQFIPRAKMFSGERVDSKPDSRFFKKQTL
jgi:hypothetical protein